MARNWPQAERKRRAGITWNHWIRKPVRNQRQPVTELRNVIYRATDKHNSRDYTQEQRIWGQRVHPENNDDDRTQAKAHLERCPQQRTKNRTETTDG